MPAIRTILFPTDFSDVSTHAFGYACELAQENRASLVALHVFEPMPVFVADGIVLPGDSETARNDAQTQLAELKPLKAGLKFECLFREGPSARTIVETAGEIGADLIVMGTHGRSGLRRLLLGSVAEEVLRQANCAVLFTKHRPPKETK